MSAPEITDYAAAWAQYRRVRRSMLVAWLGPFPVVLFVIFNQHSLPYGTVIAWLVALGWLGTFWHFNLRWVSWPCPRCGAPFIDIWSITHRRCANCRLAIWAPSGE